MNNQAVLLRGVNDDAETMKSLVHALMRIKVRPYYLYHCDPVHGAEHFRTTVEKGLEIIESLRGHTSGLAIPTYVIDAPGGGGKIPIQPQYLLSYQGGRAILRNFQDRIFHYRDPAQNGKNGGHRAGEPRARRNGNHGQQRRAKDSADPA